MNSSSRLRYVDADEVHGADVQFDDLKVRTPGGDKLGEVDGFIVDSDARRAYYVVVDSGGWFTSRKFLVPIGHARLDDDRDALVLDVEKDTISRYPQFDRDSFDRLSDTDRLGYERRYAEACCPDDAAVSGEWSYDRYQHYQQPTWWRTEYYNWDVPAAIGTSGAVAAASNRRTALDDALPGDIDNDEPEKHGSGVLGSTANRRTALDDALPGDIDNDEPEKHRDRDRDVTAREGGDVSPHLGGRAQPGDVLGIETAGETTAIGDTDVDEDKKRRDAERAAGEMTRDEVRRRD